MKKSAVWLLQAAVCIGFCANALAQDQPLTLRMVRTKVKPEMIGEYADLQKGVNEALKKTDIPWRDVWRTGAFGEQGTFVSVTPLTKFANLDAGMALEKAMGEGHYAMYLARVRKCIESSTYEAIVRKPELSIESGSENPGAYAVVTTYHIAPGRWTTYEALIKSDVLPALRKIGVKDYWVFRTQFGGDPNAYTTVYLVNTYADLDKGNPLVQGLGQEGWARLTEKFAGIIASATNEVIRHDTDLTWVKK
jgi:hypothetical protein